MTHVIDPKSAARATMTVPREDAEPFDPQPYDSLAYDDGSQYEDAALYDDPDYDDIAAYEADLAAPPPSGPPSGPPTGPPRRAPGRGRRARTVAHDLDDVRRSAQLLLADVEIPPCALRIRAGDVTVELEWTAPDGVPQRLALAGEQARAFAEPAASARSGGPAAAVAAENAAAVTAGPACPRAAGTVELRASVVGTFHRAPEPGAAPFVSEGDEVRRGQQVGIVEAMKLMIPVEAEQDGRVVAVHVENGAGVEYGDRLFTFAPVAG